MVRPKICVAGIGALGGTLAAMLSTLDIDLSVVARGKTLEVLRADGLVLLDEHGTQTCHPVADIRAPDCTQDIIILVGKSYQLADLAQTVKHAIGVQTLVVPVVNGLPWWMAAERDGVFQAASQILDPDGRLAKTISSSNLVGAVAYAMTEQKRPGIVQSARSPTLVLGHINRTQPDRRLQRLAALFTESGVGVRLSSELQCDIWNKIAANLATNPLSVLCEATLSEMAKSPRIAAVIQVVLEEVLATGKACGLSSLQSIEQIQDTIFQAGPHQTSMLQDFLAGRTLELAAIGEAITKVAQDLNAPMPVTSAILKIVEFKAVHRIQI